MTATGVMVIFEIFAILLGLVLGSFLTVCIARLPEDRSIVHPRSHCPWCSTQLGVRDLVPVLSWLVLRGRCRTCGSPISASYPLVETLTALVAWLLFRRLITDPVYIDPPHLLAWGVFLGFSCLLIVAIYVDLRHWIIPDEVSIYAVPVAILAMTALDLSGYDGWLALDWRASVFGSLLASSLLATLSLAARYVMGREALGWGDVKLVALVGAFVGPMETIFLVLLPAALLGSLVGLGHIIATRRRSYLPFGPSLAAGAFLYLFFGDWVAIHFFPGLADVMGLAGS